MNPAFKRLIIFGLMALIFVVVLEMFAYDVLKFYWITFMQVQTNYQPMEDPQAVITDTLPIEGAAYNQVLGVPPNPVISDTVSLARGKELYTINCELCHGVSGKGDGPIASHLENKPFDLTSFPIHSFTDGGIFFNISTGVPGKMPALDENLTVRERWDIVNYVRTLK